MDYISWDFSLSKFPPKQSLFISTNLSPDYKVKTIKSRINIGDSIETVRIGGGIYPTLALVNHSCDPNFVIVFWGRVAVAVASRYILATILANVQK